MQVSTTLAPGSWSTIGDPIDGDGGMKEFLDPLNNRPRAFYRLVEFE